MYSVFMKRNMIDNVCRYESFMGRLLFYDGRLKSPGSSRVSSRSNYSPEYFWFITLNYIL